MPCNGTLDIELTILEEMTIMNRLTSRQKILFGVYAMILAMIGDYLLGFGTFSTSSSSGAVSSILRLFILVSVCCLWFLMPEWLRPGTWPLL